MNKLPFLVSIPHGGLQIPEEVNKINILSDKDLLMDSDAFTQQIYASEKFVKYEIKTEIARAYVDLSREEFKIAPEYKDGLIKSHTCYNKKIYSSQPDKKLQALLIEKYYSPYHENLSELLNDSELILALDCHSMAETGPDISPDKGKERPLINLGDNMNMSANPLYTKLLKQAFTDVFGFEKDDISINKPFKGGYITRKYGKNPVDVIQIEMNRKLYLNDIWFNDKTLRINEVRLKYLNNQFNMVLERLYNLILENNKKFGKRIA